MDRDVIRMVFIFYLISHFLFILENIVSFFSTVLFSLWRLADLMEEHQEELATIESLDSGAVYTLALKTHIGMSIATLRYFAGWSDKIQVEITYTKM